MKIMLSQIKEAYKEREKISSLDFKILLIDLKKKELYFFKKICTDLQEDSPFEIYFYLMSNPHSSINAFQYPLKIFNIIKIYYVILNLCDSILKVII